MTVTTHSIVEGIDVVGHIGDRQLPVLVDLFLDPLFLQATDVRNKARTKVFYMGFTGTVERPASMSKAASIALGEASANEPPPIAVWYEIGGSIGHSFRY